MADEKDQRCILAPPQKDLSVNPLLNAPINSLDFVPHLLGLYWALNDFCTYRYSLLTDSDKKAIETLKGSSKCDAAWVACHMGQQTYGLSMIEEEKDGYSFILKSIFTFTKPLTPAEKIEFEPSNDDEKICQLYAKCACTTQEKIEESLKSTINSVAELCKNDVSWRSHLLYGTLLSLSTLDQALIEEEISKAKKKLGGNEDSNYVFLSQCGNIYMHSQQFDKGIACFEKALKIIANDGYCRPRMFYCLCKLSKYDKAQETLTGILNDIKKGGASASEHFKACHETNGSIDDFCECALNYFSYLSKKDSSMIDKLASYDRSKANCNWFCAAVGCLMEAVGKERFRKEDWMDVSSEMIQPLCDRTDKNNAATFTSTWGERMISMFYGYLIQLTCILDVEDVQFIAKPFDPSIFQFPILELSCDFKGWTYYHSGVTLIALKMGDSSLQALDTAIAARGSCFDMHVAYIVALNDSGNAPEAERKINQLKKFGGLPPSLNLIRINALRFAGAMDAASTELFKVLSESPNVPNIDMCMTLSDALCYQGKFVSALLLFSQILIQYPDKFWDLKQDWRYRFRYVLLLAANGFTEYAYKLMRLHHIWSMDDSEKYDNASLKEPFIYGVYLHTMVSLGNIANGKLLGKISAGAWRLYRRCNLQFIDGKYDKAFDDANSLVKDFPQNPLGYCLMARSNADIKPDSIENDANECMKHLNRMYENKSIQQWIYYEILLHLACAYYYCNKDASKASEFENMAKTKVDTKKAYRNMLDGSEDCRKTFIDEQLKIHKENAGNKEAINEQLVKLSENMKAKFTKDWEKFEAIVPKTKKKKKMKGADWTKMQEATENMYNEIKNNFIQFNWDYNKVSEFAKLSSLEENSDMLDSFIVVGPPGTAKNESNGSSGAPPKASSSAAGAATTSAPASSMNMDDDGKDEEKASEVVTAGGGGGGGGSNGSASAGSQGGSSVNLNDIFRDSCGLQYLTLGSKAFPVQRFVTNTYVFDEIFLLSKMAMISLKGSFFGLHNFDTSTPEGAESKVLHGYEVNGQFLDAEYAPKVLLMGRSLMLGNGISWVCKYNNSDPNDKNGKADYDAIVKATLKNDDEYSKAALGTYYTKIGRIEDSKKIFDSIGHGCLASTRQHGWYKLRIENDYDAAIEYLSEAYNKHNGNQDGLTVSYYLEALSKAIIDNSGKKDEYIGQVKKVVSACPMDSLDTKASVTAILNYATNHENRFDASHDALYSECREKSSNSCGKIIHYYYQCGQKEKQFGSKNDIVTNGGAMKTQFNALMMDVEQMPKEDKFWGLILLILSGNRVCKSEAFVATPVSKFEGTFYDCSEGLYLDKWFQVCKGGLSDLEYKLHQGFHFTSLVNICLENSLYFAIDDKPFAKGSDPGFPWSEDVDLTGNDGDSDKYQLLKTEVMKRYDTLYNMRRSNGAPFLGNKEYFLSYIDIHRLKWIGNDFDYAKKLEHSKINDLIFEYLTYFENDFNGLIMAADYWLSIGAVQAAYVAYNKCENNHSFEFYSHTIAQLKYADCLLMLGQLGASYALFKNIFERFILTDDKRILRVEFSNKAGFVYEYFLDQFSMLCFMLNKEDEAAKALFVLDEYSKYPIKHGPSGYIVESLLKTKNDKTKKSVEKSIKECSKGISGLSGNMQNYARFNNVNLKNSILKTVVSNGAIESGPKVKENTLCEDGRVLKSLEGLLNGDPASYKTSENDLLSIDENNLNDEKCKAINVSNLPISALKSIVDKALNDYKSDNGVKIVYQLDASLAMSSPAAGTGAASSSKGGSKSSARGGGGATSSAASSATTSKGSGKGSSASKSGKAASRSRQSVGNADEAGGPMTLKAVETWLEKQRNEYPLEKPKASEVEAWDAARLAKFMMSVPFYQHNVKYSEMIVSKGITGQMFLKASTSQMKLWGITSIAHCGRLRAEINQMKKRG